MKKKKKSRNFCSGLPPKCYCKIRDLDAMITMLSKCWCMKKNHKKQKNRKKIKHPCKGIKKKKKV